MKDLHDQVMATLDEALGWVHDQRTHRVSECIEVSELEVAAVRGAVQSLKMGLVKLAVLRDGRSPAPPPKATGSLVHEVRDAARALGAAAAQCARRGGATLRKEVVRAMTAVVEPAKRVLASTGVPAPDPEAVLRAAALAVESCDDAERAAWTNREALGRSLDTIARMAEDARRELAELDLEPMSNGDCDGAEGVPEGGEGGLDACAAGQKAGNARARGGECEREGPGREQAQEGSGGESEELALSRADSDVAKAILEVLSRAAAMLSLLRPLLDEQPQGSFDWAEWEVLITNTNKLGESLDGLAVVVYPPLHPSEVREAGSEVNVHLHAMKDWRPEGLDARRYTGYLAAYDAMDGALTKLEEACQRMSMGNEFVDMTQKVAGAIRRMELDSFTLR